MVDFTKILTTIVVVAMMGVGLFLTIVSVGDEYDTPRGAEFNATYSNFSQDFNSITKETTNVQNLSLGTSASQTTTSGFSFSNAIASLKLVWNFFEFLENLVVVSANAIGIPPVFIVGFMSLVTIVMTFLFLKAVFGVKP